MEELLENNFQFIFTGIAADNLNENWLGKVIDKKGLAELKEINNKVGLSISGEGGELESFVVNCHLFKKRIKITESDKVMENTYTGRLKIKEAVLE